MFGFGKALDVLRAGDAVTRRSWVGRRIELSSLDGGRDSNGELLPGGAPLFSSIWFSLAVMVDHAWEPWAPTHADLLAEDWDYAWSKPEPVDDREPHGVQQAEHWPQAVPASMWCTVDAKRAKVNSIIWSAEAKPEQLGLNCGHWVAMPADWQAPA